jgi:hypothetical protein
LALDGHGDGGERGWVGHSRSQCYKKQFENSTDYPGSTDAQLCKALGKPHEYINQQARLLESAGEIVRVKLGDG